MKTAFHRVAIAIALAGCATDGGGGSVPGNGNDVLPKRGERDTDPTIVSATASCYHDPDTQAARLELDIDASDPKGKANLGTCALGVGSATADGPFGDGSICYVSVGTPCAAGQSFAIDLTVSNETGGVTTASLMVVAN